MSRFFPRLLTFDRFSIESLSRTLTVCAEEIGRSLGPPHIYCCVRADQRSAAEVLAGGERIRKRDERRRRLWGKGKEATRGIESSGVYIGKFHSPNTGFEVG